MDETPADRAPARSDDAGNPPRVARRRFRRKWLLALLLLPVVLYVGWLAVIYVAQDSLIFPGAARPRPTTPGPTEPGIEQLWITSADGPRVEAWFKLGKGRSPRSPGPAVIYFHGNSDLIDYRWKSVRRYLDAGISALAVEYRGYGRSEGHPSERALIADAIRFYDGLKARPAVDAERIFFHGLSLGGGVAAGLAVHRPPAALILECTFSSIACMAGQYWAPELLCRHPFRSDEALSRLQAPVIIFQARRDELFPVEHGRRLHECAPDSRYVELDCAHPDFRTDWDSIYAFLADAGLLSED